MIQALSAVIASGTFRRLVVFACGLAVTALNRRFGLGLGTEEVAGVVVMVLGYLLQSSTKEGVVAKAEAAGKAAAAAVPAPAVDVLAAKPAEFK